MSARSGSAFVALLMFVTLGAGLVSLATSDVVQSHRRVSEHEQRMRAQELAVAAQAWPVDQVATWDDRRVHRHAAAIAVRIGDQHWRFVVRDDGSLGPGKRFSADRRVGHGESTDE